MSQISGRIFDIQGFSVHDGPGIRTTVFLKGCPLRCLWCHSPESQLFPPEMAYMDMRCIGVEKCGLCLTACPNGVLSKGEPKSLEPDGEAVSRIVVTDRSKCTNCGKCAETCFAKALYICGEMKTVDEVFDRVKKDMAYYRHSDGGVSISGGEPLSQPEFTRELLKRCHEAGIHTALDTTGFVQYSVLASVLPYTDLFLYDLKCMDSKMHETATGVPNEMILENAKRLAADGAKFQIRAPIITGINDNDEHIIALGEFCAEIKDSIEQLQLLPYHKLGAVKYDRLQRTCPMPEEAEPPEDKVMNRYAAMLKKYGLNVCIH